jgi:hypothetical protein
MSEERDRDRTLRLDLYRAHKHLLLAEDEATNGITANPKFIDGCVTSARTRIAHALDLLDASSCGQSADANPDLLPYPGPRFGAEPTNQRSGQHGR